MDERIARLKSAAECSSFATNAARQGRNDLVEAARRRAVELRAEEYGASTPVERECLEAVFAYEQVLSAKNGKNTRASRTWQMIERHGIITAVERAVDRNTETVGYTSLIEMGLGEFAFEAVILRHPEHFSDAAVTRSRERVTRGD